MRLPALFSAAACVLLTACAGYRLGPSNGLVAGERSVSVRPFVNQTLEPRLIEPVTASLRRMLQQDGTYRLETGGDGDVIVSGVITDFRRAERGFQPGDTLTVRDYEIELTAMVTAVERLSGRTNLHRAVTGRTTIRVGTDLPAAERQAVPQLAADLSRNITALLTDGDW